MTIATHNATVESHFNGAPDDAQMAAFIRGVYYKFENDLLFVWRADFPVWERQKEAKVQWPVVAVREVAKACQFPYIGARALYQPFDELPHILYAGEIKGISSDKTLILFEGDDKHAYSAEASRFSPDQIDWNAVHAKRAENKARLQAFVCQSAGVDLPDATLNALVSLMRRDAPLALDVLLDGEQLG